MSWLLRTRASACPQVLSCPAVAATVEEDEMMRVPLNEHTRAAREAFLRGEHLNSTPHAAAEKLIGNHANHVPAMKSEHKAENGNGTAKETFKEKLQEKIQERNSKLKKEGTNGDSAAATPAPAMTTANTVRLIEGYVGFANLPDQVYRKAVKRGFEFSLMVVGESGLGKSTFINSLFLTDIYNEKNPGPSLRVKKTLKVETTSSLLVEKGVNLKLTIVDTPGFGDFVDNTNCWQPIIDCIEQRYNEYLNEESKVSRKTIPDYRIHCCLYFIAPTGHGLKPLDVEFMKKLHDKVNIIPVIAKADTMTPEEIREFKRTILNEIRQNKIQIYEFPDCDDEEENKVNKQLKEKVPFAIVGSNCIMEVNGKQVRGRQYPWGVVDIENMQHCDFLALRTMLIRRHMHDLKDVTHNVHYENFRYRKLLASVSSDKGKTAPNNEAGSSERPISIDFGDRNPLQQLQEEREEHERRLKKMEQEMEQVFEMKVKEKELKLKESEQDLEKRRLALMSTLDQQEKETEEKRKQFEDEKRVWEEQQDELRRRSLETQDKKKEKKKLF